MVFPLLTFVESTLKVLMSLLRQPLVSAADDKRLAELILELVEQGTLAYGREIGIDHLAIRRKVARHQDYWQYVVYTQEIRANSMCKKPERIVDHHPS